MRKNIILYSLFGIILFVLRLFYGFSKFSSHDEIQIYLIGLKSYTSGVYPYFGPDVVYTQTQIPGGLQGLLVSLPLQWLKTPEAPFILLNILSFWAILFFGWYLSKRILNVPKWFIYLWLMTAPWSLEYSTHIENPSYVVVGAILFFVSIFELGKIYTDRVIHPNLSFFFIGFSIFWIMQLHLSWVLMGPFVAWVYWVNRTNLKFLVKGSVFMFIGAALTASTLVPTLLHGFGSGDVGSNVVFNFDNLLQVPTIIGRFLMFASYELTRWIGADTPSRLSFLQNHFWVIPSFIFLLLASIFQAVYFIFSIFKKYELAEWKKVKMFTLLTLALVSVSFLFSVTEPRSHTFYIVYPVALWYSFYCYSFLFKKRFVKTFAAIFIISGVLFQFAQFMDRLDDRSLFAKRELVQQAIDEMDYTIVGVRRESLLMQSSKKDIWKRKDVYGGDIAFVANFEVTNDYFMPQNIVASQHYDGNYSCKIDSIQQVSSRFSESLEVLDHPEKVRVSFWAKTLLTSNFAVTCEIRSNEGNTLQSIQISEGPTRLNWDLVELEFLLPDTAEGTLMIYVTAINKTEEPLFIDQMKLEFE